MVGGKIEKEKLNTFVLTFYKLYSESKEVKTATIAVFRQNTSVEVLIGKRKKSPDAGSWVLPGGHIDDGETPEEGARRELAEEAGVRVENLTHIADFDRDALFAVKVDEKVKIRSADDIEEVKWVQVASIPRLAFRHNEYVDMAMKKMFGMTHRRKNKGLLVVFEGVDGSGKTTSIDKLEKWLNENRYQVMSTKWKSHPLLEDAISKAKDKRVLSPLMFSLLHSADMVLRYEQDIVPALEDNKIVLCDRYIYTSLVRDGIRGVDINILKKLYRDFREPDILFHCWAPVELAVKRVLREKGGFSHYSSGMDIKLGDDKEDSCRKYESMQDKKYREILPKLPGYVKLDTTKSIDDVQKVVQRKMLECFGISSRG